MAGTYWKRLVRAVHEAATVETLVHAHEEYITSIASSCMLPRDSSKDWHSSVIAHELRSILESQILFACDAGRLARTIVAAAAGKERGGGMGVSSRTLEAISGSYDLLLQREAVFREKMRFLLIVAENRAASGASPFLSELVEAIDANRFYRGEARAP